MASSPALERDGSAPALERHRDLRAIVSEWDELVERTASPAFMRPGWMAIWAQRFAPGRLEVVAVREGGRLTALVPMVRGRLSAFASASGAESLGFEPVSDGARSAAALAAGLLEEGPAEVRIQFIDRSGRFYTALADAAEQRRYRMLTRPLRESPYVELKGTWDEYESALGGETRRQTRKKARRLEAEGGVALEVLDGVDGLEGALDEGFRLEGSAWKAERDSAILSDPVREAYYRDVARWAAGEGILRLAFLRAGGERIAFNYCVEERGVHYAFKTGYDPRYSRFSPGIVLASMMIRRAFELGLERYEFMGKSERWKASLASGFTEAVECFCFGPSPAGRLHRFSREVARPAARRLLRRGG
jgi:CelD/BcsL family acetyltransferase involved in cellulose biosynthesis